MTTTDKNSCIRCDAPTPSGEELCQSCLTDATIRTSIMPCVACGTPNPSTSSACGLCGAALKTVLASNEDDPSSNNIIEIKGRHAELRILEDYFGMSLENNTNIQVVVIGENGMGVSRLLAGFSERLQGRLPSNRIFHVHCRRDDDIFGPIRGLLRQRLLKSDDDDDCEFDRLRLMELVEKLIGDDSAALITETAHLLGFLADLPFPSSPVLKMLETDQKLMFKRIMEAVVRFLKADCADSPMSIIMDDLDKASTESRLFHAAIFEALTKVPMMIVLGGTAQIEDMTLGKGIVKVTLEPLDDSIMQDLFMEYMPGLADPPQALINAIIDKASGNPGSLKQLCALLRENGVVNTDAEPWIVDLTQLKEEDMPVSMLEALKARLERLDPRDRSTLKYASVFGEVFWDEGIMALSRQQVKLKSNIGAAQVWADDSDGLAIFSSISRLLERQFIIQLPEQEIPGVIKYAFARHKMRDAILDKIDSDEKTRLHYLAAQWICQISATVGPQYALAEAKQWENARQNQKAALCFFRAARYARSKYLNQKAVEFFKKGLTLADDLDRITIVNALHDLGSVYELLGQYDAAEHYYTEMLRHAWILVHRGKGGAALNKIGRLYRARGDSTAARAFFNRGMVLFEAAGDENGQAACLMDLGELARMQGSFDRAYKLVSQALKIQRKIENTGSVAVCLHSLGHIEASRSSYTQAERYLEEALSIREEMGDKGGTAHTMSALALVLFNRGSTEKAIERWEKALGLAEEVGARRMLAIVNNNLGEALRDMGKLEASMRRFKECESIVTTLEDRLLQTEVSRNIGLLSIKMGNLDTAKTELELSHKLARELGGREMEGLALRSLGELKAATMWDTSNVDAEDEAVIFFEKALTIFRKIGSDFEIARTLNAWGNRLLEKGDIEGGKEKLAEAMAIFTRIQSKAGDKILRTIRDIIGKDLSKKKILSILAKKDFPSKNPTPKGGRR